MYSFCSSDVSSDSSDSIFTSIGKNSTLFKEGTEISEVFATYNVGFMVNKLSCLTRRNSSSCKLTVRVIWPASKAVLTFSRAVFKIADSLLPDLISLTTLSSLLLTTLKSASINSMFMTSKSRAGLTEPSTWMMSLLSKNLTTCTIASTSRMWERNLLPKPAPSAAPLTRPAISTNSIDVGTIFSDFSKAASLASRWSGTLITPTFGSMVVNGKFEAAAACFVRALNRVDLPTFGKPTIPTENDILLIYWNISNY